MKYILMMSGTKTDFAWYKKWSKEDMLAQFAFMHSFRKRTERIGRAGRDRRLGAS